MRFSPLPLFALLLPILTAPAIARTPPQDASTLRERQVAALMQREAASPARLRAFLQAMPKGGDLHNHLGGSNYAEDFLRWADADGYCIDLAEHALRAPPCTAQQAPARGLAARDPALYAEMVDALSMRNFVPTPAMRSGHDQFFATFARFGAVSKAHRGDALVATLEQAARDQVAYVEVMTDPEQTDAAGKLAMSRPWKEGDYAANLAQIQAELPTMVETARSEFAGIDAQVQRQMRCGQADASIGCRVEYRYMTYVLRTLPKPFAFGQMAFNHALVQAGGSRFVGVNIVAPEDNPVALADYGAHMAMFGYLASQYPQVPLSLHAGELSAGLVPPADMRFHIRDAVAAGARRIGHGVDLAYEDDSAGLLRSMRQRQVAVEINLTSNDVILGVRGDAHPLAMYLRAGVPVVLSTDDEGVSRIDLTHEYQRAVLEQHLDYPTLKRIARNGIGYSFLPGESLWQADGRIAPACAAAFAHGLVQDKACSALLERSDKARLQWHLEHQLAGFEDAVLKQAAGA